LSEENTDSFLKHKSDNYVKTGWVLNKLAEIQKVDGWHLSPNGQIRNFVYELIDEIVKNEGLIGKETASEPLRYGQIPYLEKEPIPLCPQCNCVNCVDEKEDIRIMKADIDYNYERIGKLQRNLAITEITVFISVSVIGMLLYLIGWRM